MNGLCKPIGWLVACFLLAGCATDPSAPRLNAERREACMRKADRALRFSSRPDATRQYFRSVATASPREAGELLSRHYDLLGRNVSSVVLMLGGEYADRISLRLNPDVEVAMRLTEERVRAGRSPVEMADVATVDFVDEFVRLQFLPGGVANGVVYVMCADLPGRSLPDQIFVDYRKADGETAKLSLTALIRLLSGD